MTTIDTSSAVSKDTIIAQRSVRQVGEMDHPRSWLPCNRIKASKSITVGFIIEFSHSFFDGGEGYLIASLAALFE